MLIPRTLYCNDSYPIHIEALEQNVYTTKVVMHFLIPIWFRWDVRHAFLKMHALLYEYVHLYFLLTFFHYIQGLNRALTIKTGGMLIIIRYYYARHAKNSKKSQIANAP